MKHQPEILPSLLCNLMSHLFSVGSPFSHTHQNGGKKKLGPHCGRNCLVCTAESSTETHIAHSCISTVPRRCWHGEYKVISLPHNSPICDCFLSTVLILKALKLPSSTVEQNKGSIKDSAEFPCWLCPECQLSGKIQAYFIYVQKLGLHLEADYQITRHGEVKRVIGNN